jgi:nitroreductase
MRGQRRLTDMRERVDMTGPVSDCSGIPKTGLPEQGQVLELMRRRRTARAHASDPVPPEALAAVLEAVRWAPSAANRQPWELVIVTDEPLKRRLRDTFLAEAGERDPRYRVVTERQADLLLAPVVIAVCGDERTKSSFVNAREIGDAVQEELFLLTFGAAIENLLLMATACGLTATWHARAGRLPAVGELLALPPWARIVALVALGRGADTPPRKNEHMRRPVSEKVHWQRFGRGRADAAS